jgi:hypothetical protein
LEEHVRTVLRSSVFAVGLSAVVLAACGKNEAPTNRAMNDDLKRDLQLASSSELDLASRQAAKSFPLTEIGQNSAPSPSTSLKKAAGPKAVKSKTPSVKAAPEPTIATEAEQPQSEVATETPAPTVAQAPEPSAPAVPRPSPVPIDPNAGVGAGGQNGGSATAGPSNGGGSILGTIFGAVIRGGVVDGDHCDPRTDGRRGGRRPPMGTTFPNTPFPRVQVQVRSR